jgi:hypothetical protein
VAGRDAKKTRSKDEGPIGSGQCVGKGLHGLSIRSRRAEKITTESEFVFERQMNDAIGRTRYLVQEVEVVQRAALHFDARIEKSLRRLVGTSEADDVMTRINEFRDDGRADPT